MGVVSKSLGKEPCRGRKPTRYEGLTLSGEFRRDVSSKRPFMTPVKNNTSNHHVTITSIFFTFLELVTCRNYLTHLFMELFTS